MACSPRHARATVLFPQGPPFFGINGRLPVVARRLPVNGVNVTSNGPRVYWHENWTSETSTAFHCGLTICEPPWPREGEGGDGSPWLVPPPDPPCPALGQGKYFVLCASVFTRNVAGAGSAALPLCTRHRGIQVAAEGTRAGWTAQVSSPPPRWSGRWAGIRGSTRTRPCAQKNGGIRVHQTHRRAVCKGAGSVRRSARLGCVRCRFAQQTAGWRGRTITPGNGCGNTVSFEKNEYQGLQHNHRAREGGQKDPGGNDCPLLAPWQMAGHTIYQKNLPALSSGANEASRAPEAATNHGSLQY
eukprot:gene8744-biopygen22658